MPRIPVFYSFHFDNDVMRVQQVRNIGVIDGNAPVSANDWERIKRAGPRAIESWIDENMKYKRCVIVLVGTETATRQWVQYEIRKAYESGKGLFGIYIHALNCPRNGTCAQGPNPFERFTVGGQRLSDVVPCYNPGAFDAYRNIAANMEHWVQTAIANRAI